MNKGVCMTLLLASMALSACNTAQGVKRDVRQGSKAVGEAVHRAGDAVGDGVKKGGEAVKRATQ